MNDVLDHLIRVHNTTPYSPHISEIHDPEVPGSDAREEYDVHHEIERILNETPPPSIPPGIKLFSKSTLI